jgi:predicted hydrocarbon binding protein
MDLKDTLVKLYVRKYVIPRALIFDKPGFLDFKISGKTEIFARQLIVPELFFVNFEKKLIEKFGQSGAKKLYSVGKRFGYSFAQLGRFENINDHPGEAVKDWIIIATKFIEGTYAKNISQNIDVSSKTVEYSLTDFVVCEKLGYDYFLAQGGAAGVIAWIFQDSSIEGYLKGSSSKNDNYICEVVCSPKDKLIDRFDSKDILIENDLSGLEHDAASYNSFNSEVDLGVTTSFQTLLDTRTFEYNEGKVIYQNNRFFLLEATALYMLEETFSGDMRKILADTAYEIGDTVISQLSKGTITDISEILTALGWGKVTILSTNPFKVVLEHFPWTRLSSKSDFVIISNMLSGCLSRIAGKSCRFNKCLKDTSNGYLNILLES